MPPSLAIARDALLRTGVCGILARIKEERRNKKIRRNERKINKRRNSIKTVPVYSKGKLTRTNGKSVQT